MASFPPIHQKISTSVREQKSEKKPCALPGVLAKSAPVVRRSAKASVYKYKLLPGNNVRVLMGALRRRPWWHPTNAQDDSDQSLPTFLWEMYRNPKRYVDNAYQHVILNHIQNNNCLVAKKGLYFCLKKYCEESETDLLKIVPRTFYLSTSSSSSEMDSFVSYNASMGPSSTAAVSASAADGTVSPTLDSEGGKGIIWIMKPASKTNRGFGITVVRGLDEVLAVVEGRGSSAGGKADRQAALGRDAKKKAVREGWIVQEYMTRPLLVSGRKFDIRCFVLITNCPRKGMRGYFFEEAYVRTSSKAYSLSSLADKETHLTNDAVQKYSKSYGKFESGNKLTFDEWQAVVDRDYPAAPAGVVRGKILPEIKQLCALSLAAAQLSSIQDTDIAKSFELLGYDYMVDEDFNPKLIEINSNPCLEFACPLLTDLISSLIENTVRVALDGCLAPPPPPSTRTKACEAAIAEIESQPCKFSLIFPSV